MKIYGNWAFAVTAFYITFVVLLVSLVVYVSQDKVDLVVENYYDHDLVFQKQIDKVMRTKALKEQIIISNIENKVVLKYPDSLNYPISGSILMFRPDNSKLDVKIPIQPNDEMIQIINTESFNKGLWKVKVDWSMNDTSYYNEEIIIFN
ncbi:MAG: FixH family protein [Desulfobulbaceae bacterium]|nr:FixH family protein [Candidatus Kapabacteria bacterium]MBS3998974.1 FixH family protein [Desulfobulbaceae bacterium]